MTITDITLCDYTVPFEEARLKVPTKTLTWPVNRMERVSVNSFGIGAVNAHVRHPTVGLGAFGTFLILVGHCRISFVLCPDSKEEQSQQRTLISPCFFCR